MLFRKRTTTQRCPFVVDWNSFLKESSFLFANMQVQPIMIRTSEQNIKKRIRRKLNQSNLQFVTFFPFDLLSIQSIKQYFIFFLNLISVGCRYIFHFFRFSLIHFVKYFGGWIQTFFSDCSYLLNGMKLIVAHYKKIPSRSGVHVFFY